MTCPQRVSAGGRLGAPLREGLAKRAISADFQPVVDLTTGRVVEYEALARWEDDRGEHHLAAHFIGVAEDTGVVREGREADPALRGRSVHPDGPRARSRESASRLVNVSASELADAGFADKVTAALTAASMAPATLQFELADSVSVEQADYVRLNMSRLKSIGVRFALDGFGGRSANLVSLRDFDIDVVKLDCGLINDALVEERSLSLLSAILKLAEQIGVEVIAKGIETMAQHELLLQVGCRYVEGPLRHRRSLSRS